MKYFSTLLLSGAMALGAYAQTTPTTMVVTNVNGTKTEFSIAEIRDITFSASEAPEPVAANYSITVPKASAFTGSFVKKVLDANGNKIAEIDLEYILADKAQHLVAYPMLSNGFADLTKGVDTATGASVTWDYSTNAATLGEAGEAVTTLYFVDGALTLTAPEGDVAAATVVDEMLDDVRGSESISYAITKIGTQYWMAENLRATKFADGSAIPDYTSATKDEWKANQTGAYVTTGDATAISHFGLVYSGYCVTNEAGLAPKGWTIPTQAQATAWKKAGGTANANFRLNSDIWGTGVESNNMTGFSAIPVGNFSYATEWQAQTTELQFWTSTKYYDAFSKGDNLDYVRITKNKNVTITSSALGGHSLEYCHSIRAMKQAVAE